MRYSLLLHWLLLIPAVPALGATLHVDPLGSGEHPTIQAAVEAAAPGDTVLLASGVFTGDGNRDIDYLGKAITVTSASGDPATCVIDAGGSQIDPHRCFHFRQGEGHGSVLSRVTVTGGRSADPPGFTPGGGIWCEDSSPTIEDCVFTANFSGWAGGGLNLESSQALILRCEFLGNVAFREGGGLGTNGYGSPTVEECYFDGNSADLGGGIYAHEVSSPRITACEFANNASNDAGGGIYLRGTVAAPVIEDCLFHGNSGEDGGGLAAYNCQFFVVTGCTFAGNFTNAAPGGGERSIGNVGAAICSYGGAVVAQNSIVTGCHGGPAAYGDVTILCCDVFDNSDGNGSVWDQIGVAGNFSGDPLFCGAGSSDFSLHAWSPCLPANNECGVLVGAVGEGCDQPLIEISGMIVDQDGAPLPGVAITGGPPHLYSDADGAYRIIVEDGWSGVIAPLLPGYAFEPPSRSYVELLESQPGQDYTGTRLLISGVIVDLAGEPLPGVALIGGPVQTMTAADGSYAAPVPPGWSGTLTPYLPSYTFRPGSRAYVDLQSDVNGQDYTATHGAPLVVPTDYPTIQAAIDASASGDTVFVLPGVYGGYGIEFGGKDVALLSTGGPGETLIGGPLLFTGGETAAAVVDGFRINVPYGGYGEGILCSYASSPTIRNVWASGGFAWPDAGGFAGPIYIDGASSPVFENCRFWDNSAWMGGAAVIDEASSPKFVDCIFNGNDAGFGGAVCVLENSSPTFRRVVFVDNRARSTDDTEHGSTPGFGGAVYVRDSDPLFEDCEFSGNRADDWGMIFGHGGGGLYLSNSSPTLVRCTISGNGADPDNGPTGGGVHMAGASAPHFDACIVAFSEEGAGILAETPESQPSFSCCDVFGNAGGDYLGFADPTGADGNISADPFFCDLPGGDYSLAGYSPCLPENNACALQIGAYGWGCEGELTVAEALPPGRASLLQNHPNPFNPKTTIRFALPAASEVSLSVMDVRGRLVAELLDAAPRAAGYHEIVWEASAQPSGVYIYRLDAGRFSDTMKMVLLK